MRSSMPLRRPTIFGTDRGAASARAWTPRPMHSIAGRTMKRICFDFSMAFILSYVAHGGDGPHARRLGRGDQGDEGGAKGDETGVLGDAQGLEGELERRGHQEDLH